MSGCYLRWLLEEIRSADDLMKPWPMSDLADAMGVVDVTKRRRLWDHFAKAGKGQIRLGELMANCQVALEKYVKYDSYREA